MAKKSTPTLKYKISEGLAKYPFSVAAEKRKEIRTACDDMAPATLSRIENIQKKQGRMIPFDWGMKICRIVGIRPQDFINT